MNYMEVEAVLQRVLGKGKLETYTISCFCRDMNLPRSSFYRKFDSLADLFSQLIKIQIDRALRPSNSDRLEAIFANFLANMRDNRWVYINMMHLSKKCVCHEIESNLTASLANYLENKGQCSLSEIRGISAYIFNMIYTWVEHEMVADEIEMYLKMRFLIKYLKRSEK